MHESISLRALSGSQNRKGWNTFWHRPINRLYGLTSEPERLQQIRSERRPDSRYSSIAQCRREVHDAEELFRQEGLLSVNTATMSVEEIATKVLQERGMERRLY